MGWCFGMGIVVGGGCEDDPGDDPEVWNSGALKEKEGWGGSWLGGKGISGEAGE